MSANLENSAVATGLEKVSFHSNPKEGKCQRMFKLLYSWAHFTCQQDYAQNTSSQASAVCELRTSIYTSWSSQRQKNQRSNCHHSLDHGESKGIPEKHLLCFINYMKTFDYVDHNKLWKVFQEMGIPGHLTCLLRNQYAGQEAEIDAFLELSCFFDNPENVGNLIIGSSAFSKTSLNIRKFMVHVLQKPSLENFEHYFTRV